MIEWRAPLALAALVLVPALVAFLVWAARRRRAALAAFVEEPLVPAVVPDLDPRRRRLRAGLLVAAVLLLVVALAGPLWGFRWEEVRREGVDIVVALDTSRSMLATDVKPNRLARAKLAVRELLTQLHGDRMALVAFAGSAFIQSPLTLDYAALAESLDAIEVGIIPKGGTALATAIDTALEALEGHEGKHQAIILITDGEDHEGDVKAAMARAVERGVKIYAVGLGTTEGELIPGESGGYLKDRRGQVVKSRLDEETLQTIALDTGGVYLHAGGAAFSLTELYRDYLAKLERRELASTLERRWEQRFQIPLALALLLLVVEPFVRERRGAEGARAGRGWRRLAPWRWRRRTVGDDAAQPRRRHTGAGSGDSVGSTSAGAAARVAAIACALFSIAWLDAHAPVREANQLYAAGKYDEAATKYNEALVDRPGAPLLQFNLGDAQYKQGKYDEALAAFERAAAGAGVTLGVIDAARAQREAAATRDADGTAAGGGAGTSGATGSGGTSSGAPGTGASGGASGAGGAAAVASGGAPAAGIRPARPSVADADPARAARIAYNVGNTKYRLGQAAEAKDPRQTLGLYAEALAAYRRAMGADPTDLDAKVNHELVARKLEELRKKLEEQAKQQEQQPQDQQQQGQDQQQGEDQQQNEQQGDQGQPQPEGEQQAEQQQAQPEEQEQQEGAGGEKGEDEKPESEEAKAAGEDEQAGEPERKEQAGGAAEQPAAQHAQEDASAGAAGGERAPGEMTRAEAASLLDAQRSDEVDPKEIVRRLQGAGVAEPAQDW